MKKIILAVHFLILSNAIADDIFVDNYKGPFGNSLYYLLGENKASDKLFIFVEGDGGICYTFEPEKMKSMMSLLNKNDNWVAYETSKSRMCNTEQFSQIDFYHRIDEIISVVNKVKADFSNRFREIYLVGHSGGPKLILKAYHKLTGISGLVLMSGGHMGLDAMFINKIVIDGYKTGKPESEINGEIEKKQQLFSEIKQNCNSTTLLWGTRSNMFWCQMFNPSIDSDAMAISPETKILVIHGYKDMVVPVEESFDLYARLLKAEKAVNLKIFPEMDHSFWPQITEVLDSVTNWANQK